MASASVAKSLRSSAFRPPAPRTSIPTPKQQRQQSLLSRSCSQRAAAAATTTTARKTLLPTFLSGDFGRGSCRGFASYREKKEAQAGKIEQLPEVKRLRELREAIASGSLGAPSVAAPTYKEVGLSKEDVDLAMDAAFATFLLHVQSRVSNFVGEGYYTIGPCGEEMLAGVGLALRPSDPSALHYRHVSTSLVRALRHGKAMDQVLLDRARGYCVSTLDPVGGGHHCLVGGCPNDFLVTSTLASQSCPAVGRAAGLRLAPHLGLQSLPLPADGISYISLGDGSVNNAHFLSAINLAEYMQHRGFQCPTLFGISDNGICISLKGYSWLKKFTEQRLGMKIFRADGTSIASVYAATKEAADFVRRGSPAAVVYEGITRRFGHAATDRQDAYLTEEEIEAAEDSCVLSEECARLVEQGYAAYPELLSKMNRIEEMIETAFDQATQEPKVSSRETLISFNSQPEVYKTEVQKQISSLPAPPATPKSPQLMRQCMTLALDEQLSMRKNLVYIGEDVQHGGYYRVTENLHKKHGFRVADFPPDETSLIGVGIGYAQAGLIPIVEIPYAKYLDCGGDMFFEAVIMNWLSAGKKPAGMVIRLQGFDKGVFGGNYHTHNTLHLPPGLDVVAYSNGRDYARGLRNAIAQAEAGRVVMLVDSTDLINRRHLFDKDDAWRMPYPDDPTDIMPFDEVRVHGEGRRVAIVSYGNGVPTSLRARKVLEEEHGVKDVAVIDAPYLSSLSKGLADVIPKYDAVIFADVCKMGQHPQAGLICELQRRQLLPARWRSVAAATTYNPLGSTVTFLNEDDIVKATLSSLLFVPTIRR
mmetsp:Transcript_9392/g.20376  ORF Transcript_9392/g.20376 Transcript_9392/m.20376 type:complete len:816 (+) Transcript_9392:174-2621(+)